MPVAAPLSIRLFDPHTVSAGVLELELGHAFASTDGADQSTSTTRKDGKVPGCHLPTRASEPVLDTHRAPVPLSTPGTLETMHLRHYGPHELPGVVARMVRWRWPAESLLLSVPCEAEWTLSHGSCAALYSSGGGFGPAAEKLVEPGELGVTNARIVFRSLSRPGTSLRIVALILAITAAATSLSADAGVSSLLTLGLSVASLVGARVAEVIGVGAATFTFGRILNLDVPGCRIDGIDDWGSFCRLRLANRDFDRVAAVVLSAS